MQEMNELFCRDPYCREFDTKVVKCTPKGKYFEVVLEDTAFYPEGGGQPGDHGTLNGIAVLDTHRVNGEIVHVTDALLEAGQKVHGVLDWERRFDHMQQHTAEHIVSGLIHQRYGYENIGFHLGPEVITLDFSGPMNEEMMKEIEDAANEMIWKNVPVEISFPSEAELETLEFRSKKELHGVVRIVTIPGADVCACCGTHLARTGEAGVIKLLSLQNRRDGARIEMTAGRRALRDYQKVSGNNREISHLLSAKPYETASAVSRLIEEQGKQKAAMAELSAAYAESRIHLFEMNQKLLTDFEIGMDSGSMRRFANRLIEEKHCHTAAVFSKDPDAVHYVILSEEVNLRELGKVLNQRLNGRGGGSAEMIQGALHAGTEEIEQVMRELAG